ncbi:unnamed protein product [Danaus chrysippus]|uniref:(African queen) hypothetical protein n=1 Tax=Danaus chrysippus TaxID=151541 RepID=A0A8J2R3E3_9NEOP|nr:unnamed protein product [Danaus chrysippus]
MRLCPLNRSVRSVPSRGMHGALQLSAILFCRWRYTPCMIRDVAKPLRSDGKTVSTRVRNELPVFSFYWPFCYHRFKETPVRVPCKMDDEKLLKIVRNYEFLYNLKHPKYMDNVKKDIAWKEIAEQLKQSAVACKKRWQCLRDSYRRALNKKKGKTGEAAKNIKPWKYEEEMLFVTPFFVERKAQDYVGLTSDDESSDIFDENSAAINIKDNETNVSDTSYTRLADEDSEKPHTQNKNTKKKVVKRISLRRKPFPTAVLLAKLVNNQNKLAPQRGHDELDRFFLSISDTVKKFSTYEQALAKQRIFSLVSEMEIEQLASSSSTSCLFKTSPQWTITNTIEAASPQDQNLQ